MSETTKDDSLLLEERKVKALEKLANVADALTLWFEEIEKDEWSQRIQWYLAEWHNTVKEPEQEDK
jgi:glutathione synthase/RimK-type ligase-like ATP-grasp enzyme